MPRFSAGRVLIGVAAATLLLAATALEFVHSTKFARPVAPVAPPAAPSSAQRARATFARLPLQFEANAGQTDARVQFVTRGPGYTVFLAGGDAVVSLRAPSTTATTTTPAPSAAVRMQLRGARASTLARGESPLPGTTNYFIGNDPSKWRTDVPTYARVRYDDVYDGIDLVYYGNQEQLEYDFIVAPGADPDQIAFRFADGQHVYVDERGDVVVPAGAGDVRLRKPVIYQDGLNGRERVEGHFALRGSEIGFDVGSYDPARPLVIDPVLTYSTYMGGSHFDSAYAIAIGPTGSVYVTGIARSLDFPTINPFQAAVSATDILQTDVFITRINAAGTAIEYSTYLGGNSRDLGRAIAINAAGEIYVAGTTASTDFPLQGALQGYGGGTYIEGGDAFVSKLTPAGNALIFSTYVGGSGGEQGWGLALDAGGNAFVTGSTLSTNFPVVNAFQNAFGSTTSSLRDAFVFKIDAAGTALAYSTYLGGSDDEEARDVAVDALGNVYLTGTTGSTNFPVQSPFQGLKTPSGKDAFVAKLDPSGSAMIYGSYLGGSSPDGALGDQTIDIGNAIAVAADGRAYIAGSTGAGTAFPSHGPTFGPDGGLMDAFVARISPDGAVLERSSRLGGTGDYEAALGIALDAAGRVVVTGQTWSADFPTVAPIQGNFAGSSDGFVVRIAASGDSIDFSTLLGGLRYDYLYAAAVDAMGDIYAVGTTGSNDFPTVAPIRADLSFNKDTAVILKIAMEAGPPTVTVVRPNASGERVYTGTPFLIEWTASDDGILTAFDVEVSTNDGATYVPVSGCSDLPGSARSCEWSTPGPVTTKGRVRVRATDAAGHSTTDVSDARFSILAGSAALTVTQPNTALALVAGTTVQVKWNHNLGSQSWVRIDASRNGGTTWEEVAASVKNTSSSSGIFNWYVTGPATALGRVRVTSLNGPVSDISNVNFSIVAPVLTMSKPLAGTNWGWESRQTAYWNTNLGKTERVNIRLSENGGATFPFVVATNLDASKGRADITTPSLAASTNQARLKVEWVGHESINAMSPADFRIAFPFLTITKPTGPAHAWTIGATPTITWVQNLGTLDNVKIELSLDGGATFPIVLAASTKSDGKHKVLVQPAWATTQARVRITWLHPWGFSTTSPANFAIQ